MPTMARKSSVEFECGNGSLGTGRPSAAQIGSQPSPGCQSTRRSAGTDARTSALWRSYASLASVSSCQFAVKRSSQHVDGHRHLRPRDCFLGRYLALHDLEDGVDRARPPTVGVARREQHDGVGVGRPDLTPTGRGGPVDRRVIPRERNSFQSGMSPLTAACHTGMSSGRPKTSIMW